MLMKNFIISLSCCLLGLTACQKIEEPKSIQLTLLPEFQSRLTIYEQVPLTADLSHLSQKQKNNAYSFINY